MIIYRGPSALDGAPIVAIATIGSRNVKTGGMVQTWIMREDLDPVAASRAGVDSSVCGRCPHRHATGGACYVMLFQAPLSVWRAYHRGRYDAAHERVVRALLDGAPLRIGSYGDPAAVPVAVWRDLLLLARGGHTGYTHQWRRRPALRGIAMASVDSDHEEQEARAKGWRTFRVIPTAATPAPRTVECLSEARGTSCAECRMCDGARLDRATQPASVYIAPHGARAKRFLPVVR